MSLTIRSRVLWLVALLSTLAACSDGGSSSNPIAPGPVLTIEMASTSLPEAAGQIAFTVRYSTTASSDRTVDLGLVHGTSDDLDLALDQHQLVIPAGQLEGTGTLTVTDDDTPEPAESLVLTAVESGAPEIAGLLALTIEDNDSLPALDNHPASWSRTGVFSAASDCGQCHTASAAGASPAVMRAPHPVTSNQPSPQGEDISPFDGWHNSVMANALTDPYFRATMMHEVESFPALAGFIEDKCLTCHAPMGRTHAHHTASNLDSDTCPLPDGCYRVATAMTEPHAREGVSCTLCHQITDSVLPGNVNSGNYDIANSANPVIYGPFQNPQGQAMENQTGYVPQFGLQVHSSELCASCHNLFTPTIDVSTDLPTGEDFPEQTPYTEWQQSVYASGNAEEAHCQDCHMGRLPDGFLTRIAVRPNGSVNTAWPERSPFFSHEMVGGNAWLLEVMETFRSELGLEQVTQPDELQAKAQLTRDFLTTAATLTASNISYAGDTVQFDLAIANHAGHKLPTSFPSRRVWLATRVRDANGVLLFESGFPDARFHLSLDSAFTSADCVAAKKPALFDSTPCFQAHVNTVTSDRDIPVYEAVLAGTDGQITQVLLYADEFLKDNRIPPRGFDHTTAPAEVRPVGTGADPDFNLNQSGSDTVHYQLALGAGLATPLQVEAVLFYQTIRPTFIAALHGDHEWIGHFRSITALKPPPAERLDDIFFTAP